MKDERDRKAFIASLEGTGIKPRKIKNLTKLFFDTPAENVTSEQDDVLGKYRVRKKGKKVGKEEC